MQRRLQLGARLRRGLCQQTVSRMLGVRQHAPCLVDVEALQARVDDRLVALMDVVAQRSDQRKLRPHLAQKLTQLLADAADLQDLLRGRRALARAGDLGVDRRLRGLILLRRTRQIDLLLPQQGGGLGVILEQRGLTRKLACDLLCLGLLAQRIALAQLVDARFEQGHLALQTRELGRGEVAARARERLARGQADDLLLEQVDLGGAGEALGRDRGPTRLGDGRVLVEVRRRPCRGQRIEMLLLDGLLLARRRRARGHGAQRGIELAEFRPDGCDLGLRGVESLLDIGELEAAYLLFFRGPRGLGRCEQGRQLLFELGRALGRGLYRLLELGRGRAARFRSLQLTEGIAIESQRLIADRRRDVLARLDLVDL